MGHCPGSPCSQPFLQPLNSLGLTHWAKSPVLHLGRNVRNKRRRDPSPVVSSHCPTIPDVETSLQSPLFWLTTPCKADLPLGKSSHACAHLVISFFLRTALKTQPFPGSLGRLSSLDPLPKLLFCSWFSPSDKHLPCMGSYPSHMPPPWQRITEQGSSLTPPG